MAQTRMRKVPGCCKPKICSASARLHARSHIKGGPVLSQTSCTCSPKIPSQTHTRFRGSDARFVRQSLVVGPVSGVTIAADVKRQQLLRLLHTLGTPLYSLKMYSLVPDTNMGGSPGFRGTPERRGLHTLPLFTCLLHLMTKVPKGWLRRPIMCT